MGKQRSAPRGGFPRGAKETPRQDRREFARPGALHGRQRVRRLAGPRHHVASVTSGQPLERLGSEAEDAVPCHGLAGPPTGGPLGEDPGPPAGDAPGGEAEGPAGVPLAS
jgi:hypothetical protein